MDKNLSFKVILFVLLLILVPCAQAGFDVQVKGLSTTSNISISAMAGETIPISLIFSVQHKSEDIIAKALLNYSNGKTEVVSAPFDILENSTYILDAEKALFMGIPADIIESDEHATIIVTLEDKDGDILSIDGFEYKKTVNILIQRESNKIEIKSLAIPDVFNSGESSLITATIKNTGSNSQDNVYAEARIPALGIISKRLVGYISPNDGKNEISIELPVILPEQVKAGVYSLKIRAFNDETSAEQTADIRITGVSNEVLLSDITPQQSIQEIEQGKRATYKITIINLGTSEQTYHLFVKDTQNWGTVQVTPSVLTLGRDKSATAEVYVVPKEDAKGVQRFQIIVESGNEIVKQIDLVADIKKAQTNTNTTGTGFTQLAGLNISNIYLVGIAIIIFFFLLMIMAFRIRRIYGIKLKAVEAVSEAKEAGRAVAKQEASELVSNILGKVLEAEDKHLEVAKERAAGRAQNVIENLREDEIEEVFSSAVQKLGEKKTEGMNEKARAEMYDTIKDHSHDIIKKLTHKLSEKELDDVVGDVSEKLSGEEVEETGVDKTIETLAKLREKLGDQIEKLKVVEEEEVSGKVKKSKKKSKKSKKKAKKKGKKKRAKAKKKKLKGKNKSKGKSAKKKIKRKKLKRGRRNRNYQLKKKSKKKAKKQKRKIKRARARVIRKIKEEKTKTSENPVLEKIVTKEVTRKF